MKRSFFPFLLAALIAVGLVFSAQQDHGIRGEAFEKQLRAAAQGQHFSIVNEEAASQDELALPLTVRWHPRRWGPKSPPPAADFPDSVQRFGFVRDQTSRVDCFVRYLDGRAQVVEIRAASKETQSANDLRAALLQAFPTLPIKLKIE